MADPRFFTRAAPATLEELARVAGATLAPGADPARMIADVAALGDAGPSEISFLDNRKYVTAFRGSAAGACIVAPEYAEQAPDGMALLLSKAPYMGWAHIVRRLYPEPAVRPGVAPGAVVDPAAIIGASVEIGPNAVIGAGAEIGDGCRIGPGAVIGDGVVLGEGSSVGANASISHALIGKRCKIYPGARIGQDGFGFAMHPTGHVRIPQLGRVVIEDDVEVGANAAIDRGAGPDTVIGRGTMIDNLVQIGHNVAIGRGCVIVSQVGISGSTRVGDFAALGGQAGIAGHLTIGSGAQISAQSGVIGDVPAGAKVVGFPAAPTKEFFRQTAMLRRLVREKRDEKKE